VVASRVSELKRRIVPSISFDLDVDSFKRPVTNERINPDDEKI